jgi:hypothetical protein
MQEADGDLLTFKSSLGDLTGKIAVAIPDGNHTVFSIDLTDSSFAGTNFSVSVAKSTAGDGRTIVGYVNAGTNNLGVVNIAADLGNIDAGSGSTSVRAMKSLTVDSLGRFGQWGTGNSQSIIVGDVGAITVKRDIIESAVFVRGNLDSAYVGGSVIGGDITDSGEIYARDNLGRVTIGHDVRGSNGAYSGSVGAGRNVVSVTIGGSLYGGNGNNSGNVFAGYVTDGQIDRVLVKGSVIGGRGTVSGAIGGFPAVGVSHYVGLLSVAIRGDVIGGSGDQAGYVYASTLGLLTVKGSLIGGSGIESGQVGANDLVKSIVIREGVFGGSGLYAGEVYSGGGIGFVNIHGDLRGGNGEYSGTITGHGLGIESMHIDGAIILGTGNGSGTITID